MKLASLTKPILKLSNVIKCVPTLKKKESKDTVFFSEKMISKEISLKMDLLSLLLKSMLTSSLINPVFITKVMKLPDSVDFLLLKLSDGESKTELMENPIKEINTGLFKIPGEKIAALRTLSLNVLKEEGLFG